MRLSVGVSPSAYLPLLTPPCSWLTNKWAKRRSASGAEVGLVTTDNWATPTELNITWLAHAKELGYMLLAAANQLALWCICFGMVAVITTNLTRGKLPWNFSPSSCSVPEGPGRRHSCSGIRGPVSNHASPSSCSAPDSSSRRHYCSGIGGLVQTITDRKWRKKTH